MPCMLGVQNRNDRIGYLISIQNIKYNLDSFGLKDLIYIDFFIAPALYNVLVI